MRANEGHSRFDVDILKVDAWLVRKNLKCHFSRDIENSFHEVTHMGLEPQHFFIFEISQQIWSLEMFKVLDKMGRSCRLIKFDFFFQICTKIL